MPYVVTRLTLIGHRQQQMLSFIRCLAESSKTLSRKFSVYQYQSHPRLVNRYLWKYPISVLKRL